MKIQNPTQFYEGMKERMTRMANSLSKIRDLVSERKISSDREQYAQSVLMFDFALAEADGMSQIGTPKRVIANSMAEARVVLDSIAAYAIKTGDYMVYNINRRRYDAALRGVEFNLVNPAGVLA